MLPEQQTLDSPNYFYVHVFPLHLYFLLRYFVLQAGRIIGAKYREEGTNMTPPFYFLTTEVSVIVINK